MKLDKKQNRLRRARRARAKIRELKANRLSVHRTPRHIYAQILGPEEGQVLASASTLEVEVRKGIKSGGNVEAAVIVGARIAEKAKAAGIDTVAFDRSGFRYHGRAREAGLKF
jgi:large subunit ribosomal protein L18